MEEIINQEQSYDAQNGANGREFKSDPADIMNLIEAKPKAIGGGGSTGPFNRNNPRIQNDETQAMRNILEKFHNIADQSISRLDEKEIKQLSQKKVSVDREWKVIVNESGEKETFYDIINTKANKSYFSKIKTLEAADLIIEHLELRKPINSQHIFKILNLDETFRRNRTDAIQFKNKFKRLVAKGKLGNADIYEARYQKSKNLALDAKRQLRNM